MFFVRTASAQDIPAIGAVLATTWRATYTPFYGAAKVEEIIASWHSPQAITANIARLNGEYLVADDGKQIAGIAFASLKERKVTLHQLYILPQFQGQGVGKLLYQEIENSFADADKIALEVEPQNYAAISFYEAQGFISGETIANCGTADSGIPALKMTKSLNQ